LRYIIGVGNSTMADDGIGLRIVEHLARRGLEQGFEAVAIADEGTRLLFYLTESTEKVVIVDAVDMGLEPGEYRLFRPEDVETQKGNPGLTTHEGDVLRVLKMARGLGYPVPPVTILGIQPENLEPGLELSPALEKRLDTYIRVALDEVRRNG
jgi:hydrogenase maturation protease